jgi:methyl-accepting chemotaxis protein
VQRQQEELDVLVQQQRGAYRRRCEVPSPRANASRSTLLLVAVALVLAAGFAFMLTRSITVPLRQSVDVARRVAAGDLSSRVHVEGRTRRPSCSAPCRR